jgi:hypothetical protein
MHGKSNPVPDRQQEVTYQHPYEIPPLLSLVSAYFLLDFPWLVYTGLSTWYSVPGSGN